MRNPLEAQRLTLEAVTMLDAREEESTNEAEKLLRQALVADLYHGPAHNNLGVLYLSQDKLYEAASEFEWARRLMPGHPDPRLNLALTFERAGRINEALALYTAALDVYPGHLPTIQALTRCELRHDRRSNHTHEHLETIALRGASDHWRSWARQQLTLGRREN